MACILNIETSTDVCSVALSDGQDVLFEKTSYEGHSHASLLGVYVEEALKEMKKNGRKLDAVAVSSGLLYWFAYRRFRSERIMLRLWNPID